LFGGKPAVTIERFGSFAAGDAQLTIAREIGMIFTYMNLDTVWQSFCDTYNGILSNLEDFDTWYRGQTGAVSSLATDWPLFIRSELDMVVTNARNNLKLMYQNRKAAGVLFTNRWRTIMAVNGGEIQKVKLDRTDKCRNLPASTVGLFTG
jgi:hypothetical protein